MDSTDLRRDPGRLQRIAQGRTAEVFAWSEGQVLKLFFEQYSGVTAESEIYANRQLPMHIPVPRMIDVVEIDGRRGIVFERVEGEMLGVLMSRQPWRMGAFAREFAALQAQIHQHSAPALPDYKTALRQAIHRVSLLSADEKQRITAILDQLPDGDTLCHCDYHPEQVLMGKQGAYIVDWVNACRGDAAAGVARSLLILKIGVPPRPNPVEDALIRLFVRWFRNAYTRHYFKCNPAVNRTKVDAWMLPVAAARLAENIDHERGPLLAFVHKMLAQR